MKFKAALGVLFALGLAGSAMADVLIDFSTNGATDAGTLSYFGGTTPLFGTNIAIGGVQGLGTPSNAGPVFAVTGGLLDFQTGNETSFNSGTWNFAGGGSVTITGSGPGCLTVGGCSGGNGIAPLPNFPSGPTLLTGSVVSASYTGGGVKLAVLIGSDTKDPLLLQFFGLVPKDHTYEFSGTVHTGTPTILNSTTHAFKALSSGSTDIQNTVVPDGGVTLTLLGGVMVGIETLRRKLRA